MALLATAYEQPIEPYLLAKLRRACELWNPGERALAHIHLAHANLPPCGPDQALRQFVADELLEAGVTPAVLMTAQGFDPAPLVLLKYNPDQPRVPAGSGRENGEWTSGGANITPVAFRGGGSRFEWIDRFLELLREPRKEPAPEEKPPEHEVVKPEVEPVRPPAAEQRISTPKPSDFVGEDFGKLGVGVEKPELSISQLSEHGEFRAQTRGVSIDDLQSTVENPLIVLRQSSGRFLYLSDKAVVVLAPDGAVVTTYPASMFDSRISALLDHVYQRGGR